MNDRPNYPATNPAPNYQKPNQLALKESGELLEPAPANNLIIPETDNSAEDHFSNWAVKAINVPDIGVHYPVIPTLNPLFWQSLTNISSSFDGPWLVMGDFNAVLSQQEKQGGRPFASTSRNWIGDDFDACNLIDFGFSGSRFTWSNKRSGLANIQSRLDRGVANAEWCLLYPKALITHLPAIASDHSPLLLDTHPNTADRPRPFFFEKMWCRDFSCETVVADTWISFVAGTRLVCAKKYRLDQPKIEELQGMNQTFEILEREQNLQCELDEQLKRLKIKWSQKVKQKWLEDGDANTRFFHLTAILQSKANFIHSIQTGQGNAVTEWELIGNEFLSYFISLFTSDLPQHSFNPTDSFHELFPCLVSACDNQEPRRIPSADEIKDVVFEMASLKPRTG
ncbi:UNVERIFIED_CONTAM: hypothetical protein Slati_3843400, partial [Sesamum latifolium]